VSAAGLAGWAIALLGAGAAAWAWARLRSRMELVARAAHELRSPLCAARLAVHAAARERGWPALAPVDRELARAGLALEDLGAARAGGRAGERPERLDAVDLLHEVRETWAPLAWPVRREVRVEPTTATLLVRADRLRLAQALGNLVGNALEHGSGSIVLRARGEGDRVRFEVEDRGAGLPLPLAALTRRPRAGRGARGRGLAIAQEIARRHDGTLREERTTGGCRLVVELPSADARPAAAPSPEVDLLAALRWGGVARPAARRAVQRSVP
jgi:signal transduction histidine kinase